MIFIILAGTILFVAALIIGSAVIAAWTAAVVKEKIKGREKE